MADKHCDYCGKLLDADNQYYCIAYSFKREDDSMSNGNRYACRNDPDCMAWALAHVVVKS